MKNSIYFFVLFCLFTLTAFTAYADVRMDGSASVKISEYKNKKHAIQAANSQAIYSAIKSYVDTSCPSMLGYIERKNLQHPIMEQSNLFIKRQQLLSKQENNGEISVLIRAELDTNSIDDFLFNRSAIASAASEHKSQFAFVFVARQKKLDSKGFEPVELNTEIETGVKTVFQKMGYSVMSNYQFSLMTDNAFNQSVLEHGYANTGKVDWNSAEQAALMSDSTDTDVYMVIGTFDVFPLGEDEISLESAARIESRAQIVNPISLKSLKSIRISDEASADTQSQAISAAINKTSRKMAKPLACFLMSKDII